MKNKNVIPLFILLVILYSCTPKAKKPFVVVGKQPSVEHKGFFLYDYQDSLGYRLSFYDRDIYQIGDTLK